MGGAAARARLRGLLPAGVRLSAGLRGRPALAAGSVALASAALIAATNVRLEAIPPPDRGAGLLYLPSGGALRLASLGERPLVADLFYLWAIQYYGNYDREQRYEYVEKIFDGVITELDPHYRDAYWLGALIMSVEAKDLDAALRLLDKGIAANPDEWRLPYLAGWECYFRQRYDLAGAYFQKATGMPGAPASIQRACAAMFARSGDREGALARWQALADDPTMDGETRSIAARRLRDLSIERDLGELRAAIEAWRGRYGAPPARLELLPGAGLIRALPRDPDGRPYAYDPASGSVTAPEARLLEAP